MTFPNLEDYLIEITDQENYIAYMEWLSDCEEELFRQKNNKDLTHPEVAQDVEYYEGDDDLPF